MAFLAWLTQLVLRLPAVERFLERWLADLVRRGGL